MKIPQPAPIDVLVDFACFAILLVQVSRANVCTSPDKTAAKTWGRNCQNPCHCRHNYQCDSSGRCPTGCASGWQSRRPGEPCHHPKQTSIRKVKLLRLDSRKSHRPIRDKTFINLNKSGDLNVSGPVRMKEACVRDTTTKVVTKSWSMPLDPPLVLKMFSVIFDVNITSGEKATAKFIATAFPSFALTRKLQQTNDHKIWSAEKLKLFLTDFVEVAVQSSSKGSTCRSPSVIGFSFSALPVCLYRKWGLRCQNNCPCPCETPECHPITGACLPQGRLCPPTRYGPSCSLVCSQNCLGVPRECHILTGACKACNRPNLTGASCDSELTAGQADEIYRTCRQISPRVLQAALDQSNETHLAEEHGTLSNSRIAMIVMLVFVSALTFLCCFYVWVVKYCAKKRLKEQYTALDDDRNRRASMVTYTEFKREFLEMQDVKSNNGSHVD